MSALSIKSELSVETVRRLVYGMGTPSEPTLAAVAEALNIPLPTIRKWAGRPVGESEPYSPPPEAQQLNTRQRKAVDELIRSMVAKPAADAPASSNPTRADYAPAARKRQTPLPVEDEDSQGEPGDGA